MDILMFLAPIAAFPLAFWAGRASSLAERIAWLLGILLLPIAILTIMFLPTDSAHGLFFGLAMAFAVLGLPMALWCFAAIAGFFVGRSSRKPPA